MKHIYHYCAVYKNGYIETTIDGIACIDNEILTMDDYTHLKELIVKDDDILPKEIAIYSITKLK